MVESYLLKLRKKRKTVMVSKAQTHLVKSSFDASFPEGIPSEQKTKDLLRSEGLLWR